MEKSLFVFFLTLSLICFPVACFCEEDSLLSIRAFPDQNSVKIGMMFLVGVEVKNSSEDTSTEFWGHSCSYEKHWVTDQTGVWVQPWTCNENSLEQITLDPGSSYEKNIILYVPRKDESGPVTFRLGFKRMSENGDFSEPLWSDPVTMDVIVPEGIHEAVSDGVTSGNLPSTDPDVAVAVAGQSSVFQDPGVPITVGPGQEFSIALASNPSTGFRWKMTLSEDQEIVTSLGSEHVVSREVMPGVPGQEVFKFKASMEGETTAAFVYERPWEPKTAPTRKIFTIIVQKN